MQYYLNLIAICTLLSSSLNSFGMNQLLKLRQENKKTNSNKDILEGITGYDYTKDLVNIQIIEQRITNADPYTQAKIMKFMAGAMHDINTHVFYDNFFKDSDFCENINNWRDEYNNTFLHLVICYNKGRFLDKTIKMIDKQCPDFISSRNRQGKTPLLCYVYDQVKSRKNHGGLSYIDVTMSNNRSPLEIPTKIIKIAPEKLESDALKILANYTLNKAERDFLKKYCDSFSVEEQAVLQEKLISDNV